MEGKIVNGKGVWRREGVVMAAYMFCAASNGEWHVGSSKEAMEAGEATGDLSVETDAVTPDAATAQWEARGGEEWQNAPKITTRICTEHERQAMVRQAEEEAVAKAKEARIIVLAGQEALPVLRSLLVPVFGAACRLQLLPASQPILSRSQRA
jgi:hypothetical protein